MTNEQAIKMLKSKMDGHTDTSYEWAETVRMAIRALEQQPCEDCVSRNAISQTLNTMYRYVADELTLCDTDEKFPKNEVFIVDEVYEQIIEQLPSVIPHPKTEKLVQDCISRNSIKQKLQEHHDFYVNAYGGFSNLPQNDKSRVDEITNCIAMVVNEPPVTSQPTRWIPISERLPEKEGYYLVTIDGLDIARYEFSWLTAKMEWDISGKVLAWMPLPEPHREDFEDDN